MFNIKNEFKKIRIELSILKPEFKLAKLNSKITKSSIILESKRNEIKELKLENILIDLDKTFALKTKDQVIFVSKRFVSVKDDIISSDHEGIYQGYFVDLFTHNVVCHFKEVVDYEKEEFNINLISKGFNKVDILPISDFIDLKDIYNGQVLLSTLKKSYLKYNKKRG